LAALQKLELEVVDFGSWHASNIDKKHPTFMLFETYIRDMKLTLPPKHFIELDTIEKAKFSLRVRDIHEALELAVRCKHPNITISRWTPQSHWIPDDNSGCESVSSTIGVSTVEQEVLDIDTMCQMHSRFIFEESIADKALNGFIHKILKADQSMESLLAGDVGEELITRIQMSEVKESSVSVGIKKQTSTTRERINVSSLMTDTERSVVVLDVKGLDHIVRQTSGDNDLGTEFEETEPSQQSERPVYNLDDPSPTLTQRGYTLKGIAL